MPPPPLAAEPPPAAAHAQPSLPRSPPAPPPHKPDELPQGDAPITAQPSQQRGGARLGAEGQQLLQIQKGHAPGGSEGRVGGVSGG